jgi:hypothetical protein
MTFRGHRSVFILVFAAFTVVPAFAQQAPPASDDRIHQLERRLDELLKQAADIRQQLDGIKGTATPTTTSAPAPATADDLMNVDVVNAAPQPAPVASTAATSTETPAKETPPPALTDVQTVTNASNPGASKVFNPDISVIGNFFGKAGQANAIEFGQERPAMQLEEAEVAFEAFVDPYAKAKFFLAATPDGVEIEEGYANFVTLPKDFTAKVGKMKATFGKANTWHTHVRPWVDQPLVIHNFFGDEQLADHGISVSRDIANPFNVFVEATGEVFRGSVANVFEHNSNNDLFYNGHLKFFRDLSENANLELGTSYARGTFGSFGANSYAGLDVTYRWKPLQQGLYRGLIARLEAIANDHPAVDRRLNGFYASADYQLGQRWFTGVRIDSAARLLGTDVVDVYNSTTDRGVSATLTFWPSEFSQVRAQLRRTKYGLTDKAVNELLFQLQFAIGAHGAHAF